MNKKHLTQTVTALLIAITALAYGNAAAAGTATMKMTTAMEGEVMFWLSGTGEVVIDWGDGSVPDTATIYESFNVPRLTHTFSGTTSRTIVLEGQNITHIRCDRMQLTALDVTGCTELTSLYCQDNQLTSLNVTGCTALAYLDCNNNQLTSLDLIGCTALIVLRCNDNQLTGLNVTKNMVLEWLDCFSNKLNAEGLNALFGTLHSNDGKKDIYIGGNPGTDGCDRTIATAKGWVSTDIATMTMTTAIDGEVDIRLAGTEDAVIDWGDGSASETFTLSKYFGQFNDSHYYTHTFSEATPRTITISGQNITHLRCDRMQLTAIDVTKNRALGELLCTDNRLTSLDVTKNIDMFGLICSNNQLTSLDINTSLIFLHCQGNQLTTLDVSKNTALRTLYCGNNQLTSLDITKNTELTGLDCRYNRLTSLDVTNNIWLYIFYCNNNQLKNLDVTNNTVLDILYCDNNQLTSLDITNNTRLSELNCSGNQLISLDITKNIWLRKLDCGNNQLNSLDVTNNTKLTTLSCYSNQLTSLDFTNNTALTDLVCHNNQFTDEGLNALFGTLHGNTSNFNKRISIADNPGTAGCNQSIATAKGWSVNTTPQQ